MGFVEDLVLELQSILFVVHPQDVFFKQHSITQHVIVGVFELHMSLLLDQLHEFLEFCHVAIENRVGRGQVVNLTVGLTEVEEVFVVEVEAVLDLFLDVDWNVKGNSLHRGLVADEQFGQVVQEPSNIVNHVEAGGDVLLDQGLAKLLRKIQDVLHLILTVVGVHYFVLSVRVANNTSKPTPQLREIVYSLSDFLIYILRVLDVQIQRYDVLGSFLTSLMADELGGVLDLEGQSVRLRAEPQGVLESVEEGGVIELDIEADLVIPLGNLLLDVFWSATVFPDLGTVAMSGNLGFVEPLEAVGNEDLSVATLFIGLDHFHLLGSKGVGLDHGERKKKQKFKFHYYN